MTNKAYSFNIFDDTLNELALDVKKLYRNKDIVNYIHNGRPLPAKYAKLLDRPISSIYSNIDGYISLQRLLTNTLQYCFTKPTNKNTVEVKQIKETIDRLKLLINNLKSTNSTSTEIEQRNNEIKLLNKKIEDLNNVIENNNSIKNKYVDVAETVYNILLRKDNYPQYFYTEVCKKLGVRINFEQHFVRDYGNQRFSVKDGEIKKEFTNKIDEEDAMIYAKSYKSKYIPPCFRKPEEENKEVVINKKIEITKEEDFKTENIKVLNLVELFPELKSEQNIKKQQHLGVWEKKPNLIVEENKNEVEVNKNTNIINLNRANKTTPTPEFNIEEKYSHTLDFIETEDSWNV